MSTKLEAAARPLHSVETIKYWADAYSNPASGEHFQGHGMVVALLREYASLREALAEQAQDLEHNKQGQACPPTYAYSLNGENYTAADGDTRESALHEGQAEACEEREPGDKVTIYTGVKQTPFDVLRKQAENIGAHLIENLEERAAEEIPADDLIIFTQPCTDAALGNLVIDWIEKNATARYFAVDDVQKHDYTVEGDAQ